MNKNITTKTFSTFITTLKEELKGGYSLVKFQHKVGFFCGVLSNDNPATQKYKDTLASINPEAKELVLKKIAALLDNEDVAFVAEGEMVPYEKGEDVPSPMIREDKITQEQPKKQRRSRKTKSVEE